MANEKKIKGAILYFILLIFLLISLYLFYILLLKDFIISLSKNLFYTSLIANAYLSLIFIPLISFFIFKIAYIIEKDFFENKDRFNPWAIMMIIYMICIFILGVSSYNLILGQPPLELTLYEKGNKVIGDIICGDKSNNIYAGNYIKCHTSINISSVNGKVIFTKENGDTEEQGFYSDISFYAINDIKHIRFEFSGILYGNESSNFSTGTFYKFYEYSNMKDYSMDFLYFLYILFGVVFLAIPTSFYYMKKIIKNKD